jgi:hypothetical protein
VRGYNDGDGDDDGGDMQEMSQQGLQPREKGLTWMREMREWMGDDDDDNVGYVG